MFSKPRTKRELTEGVNNIVRAKMQRGRSTILVELGDGSRYLQYQYTKVIIWNPDGSMVLDSGNWRTPTTKNRINTHQKLISIYQRKRLWFFNYEGEELLFYDGITFDAKGKLLTEKRYSPTKSIITRQRQIGKFVNLVDTIKKIPLPASGDCLICQFDANLCSDHLLSHVQEKYLHGSLIYRALRERGYPHPELLVQMDCRPSIKRALRSYLTRQLIPEIAYQ